MATTPITYNDPTVQFRYNTINKTLLFLIYGIFLLLPWYYNGSGQIQPVDIFIGIITLLFIYRQRYSGLNYIVNSKTYAAIILLLICFIIQYIVSYVIEPDRAILLGISQSIYYLVLLNTFISILFYLYNPSDPETFYKTMINCITLSIILPLGVLLFHTLLHGYAGAIRETLTFNNPNQLGFYALINMACLFYCNLFANANNIKIKKFTSLFLMNIDLYFLFMSASRGSSPLIILYILSYPLIFKFRATKEKRSLFWLLISLIALIMISVIAWKLYQHMLLVRSSMLPTTKSGIFQDIYFREAEGLSYNFSNIFIFLFGQGVKVSPLRYFGDYGIEFHNNFISIFNQIGMVGLLLYIYLIVITSINLFRKSFYHLMPFLVYLFFSLFSYAFRTRINWLFFAMMIFIIVSSKKKSNAVKYE